MLYIQYEVRFYLLTHFGISVYLSGVFRVDGFRLISVIVYYAYCFLANMFSFVNCLIPLDLHTMVITDITKIKNARPSTDYPLHFNF